MTTFIFGNSSDLIRDFFLVVLSGFFVGATVYAALAYPKLRRRELKNTESYRGLGLFLWGAILLAFIIGSYWSCSHRFTGLQAWESEIVLEYSWPSRKVHVPCNNLNYMELLSHPKQATRQILVYTQDRVQYKSRKLPRSKFEPMYEQVENAVCKPPL
ncbi:hypothetical protein [Desulfatibacillum aliphaticivorans]|uniref:Uncharacterized protein n=1 Tax=Desulfatibacillum aliphaticivorans TaxID=218208 RepID=B8FM29_DESAL|nr:hypothetical protein [Desulfatibacillum aliphaticivorans]ACL05762.1 hypothetical protein Dalk_4077 [Desulfatibacillum aliphaticivorans]